MLSKIKIILNRAPETVVGILKNNAFIGCALLLGVFVLGAFIGSLFFGDLVGNSILSGALVGVVLVIAAVFGSGFIGNTFLSDTIFGDAFLWIGDIYSWLSDIFTNWDMELDDFKEQIVYMYHKFVEFGHKAVGLISTIIKEIIHIISELLDSAGKGWK